MLISACLTLTILTLDATLTVFSLRPVCLVNAGDGEQRREALHPYWPRPTPVFVLEPLMRRAAVRPSRDRARLNHPVDGAFWSRPAVLLTPRHLRHWGEARALAGQALAGWALPVYRQGPIVALSTAQQPMLLDCASVSRVWPGEATS
jgi:hypothetical protein